MADAPARDDEPWRRAERAAMLRRRRRAGLRAASGEPGTPGQGPPNAPVRELPTVGLALSGGGIRSATFCLGLLRGMASKGLLPRIDYLSTVSGGGYAGAMFGRLVLAVGLQRAQELLADGRSPVLEWLRRYGRYLTPAGSRDAGAAAVTYLRAFIAIHGELANAGLLFGLLVVLPHLWQVSSQALEPQAWQPWGTLWWPLALAWMALAATGPMCGYWLAREGRAPTRHDPVLAARDLVFAGALGGAAAVLTGVAWRLGALAPLDDGAHWAMFGLLALWSMAAGIAYTLVTLTSTTDSRGLAVARLRNRLTAALRVALGGTLVLGALGALDLASWRLLELALADHDWLWGGLGLGGIAAIVLRTLMQPLQQMVTQAGRGALALWAPRLLNVAGIAMLALVLTFWLTAVQWFVFSSAPLELLARVAPAWRALGLFALVAGWWALTAANEGMANASSLHTFYRARLTRAWLSVGNPLRPVVGAATGDSVDVTRVVSHDDADLREYRPERRGGPMHLVNCCLNQTRDDASGLYNADRKGTLATALPDALEIGARDRVPWGADGDVGTLGRWVAVSGAAVAPGAGAYTSRGWALLLFLLGVRLGHWMRAPVAPVTPGAPGSPAPPLAAWRAALWRLAAKPLMLWSEASATYFGRTRPWWYLSDGGHYENTGVYALLKRELDFIVLADCSADRDYDFDDLENLVRKARIDLDAEIEFYAGAEAIERFGIADGELTVVSPEDMVDSLSARGVLLARIRYHRSDAAAPLHHGTLLVIKPNLHNALDVDLLGYATKHPAFPHEGTGDQSFDEAQWESYQRLGHDAGAALGDDWLARVPGWRNVQLHLLTQSARLRHPGGARPDGEAPAWRRTARAAALGTTLGVGASGTLLVALWQVGEQIRQNQLTQRSELRAMFTEASKALSAIDLACPKVPDHVTLQVTLLRDVAASPTLLPIDRAAVQRLIERTREQCDTTPTTAAPECGPARREADAGLCAVVSRPLQGTDALSYWHPVGGSFVDVAEAWQAALALWRREPPQVAVAPAPPAAPAAPAAPATPATPAPPATAPGPIAAAPPAAPPAAAPAPVPAPGATASAPAAGEAPGEVPPAVAEAPTEAARLCRAGGETLRLYIQVYDETSRDAATALRTQLAAAAGAGLQVAPIENVTRSAALRDERRPVPWRRPTFIFHHRADEACARALAGIVRERWPSTSSEHRGVWVGELPASLRGGGRVIELWLPPRE